MNLYESLRISRIVSALLLAAALLFALPLALYGHAFADVASAQNGQQAQLLLYPDPVDIAPGESAVVDVRLSVVEPATQVQVRLQSSDPFVHFAGYFEGTETGFRVMDKEMTGQDLSLTLVTEQPFTGSGVLGRVLISAANAAQAGQNAQLAYGEGSTLLGADGAPRDAHFRPADIRILQPGPIKIVSKTHTDENLWFQRRSANATWETKKDTLYSYEVSPLPTDRPDTTPEDVVGSLNINELTDGIWYFSLCDVTDGTCDAVSRRRYMIDTTPPEAFTVSLTADKEGRYLTFAPYDGESGIARTEIAFDPAAAHAGEDNAWVAAISPYRIPDGVSGPLLVRALDLAGNARETTITVPNAHAARRLAFTSLAGALVAVVLIRLIRKGSRN